MKSKKTYEIIFEDDKLKDDKTIKKTKLELGITKQFYKENNNFYTIFDIKDLLLFDIKLKNKLIYLLKNEIKRYIKLTKISLKSVLILGIGNKNMIADCLGDKVVEKILSTRQFDKGILDDRFINVSSYSLGVFGKTGIESANVCNKLCEIVKPDLVILIDTFVTIDKTRFNKSVQLSSCGISPGAGVDNARKYINYEFLKIPVFSIGVPLLFDLEKIKLFVMDKEIEKYVKFYSDIIASGINLSLHKDVSLNEMLKLIF